MSRPMADTPKRRARRPFTDEFKASAVRLVLDEGKTVGAAARDLDLTETALREYQARPRGPDGRTHRPHDRGAKTNWRGSSRGTDARYSPRAHRLSRVTRDPLLNGMAISRRHPGRRR
jgi:transposase-like protein